MSNEREWLRVSRPRAGTRRPGETVGEQSPLREPARRRIAPPCSDSNLRRIGRLAGNRRVQRYAKEHAFVASEDVERAVDAQAGGGSSLDHATRGQMEGALKSDLSAVRIHSDAQAAALSSELSARAFTRGNDIYFGSGEYAPATSDGQRLLAHELAHVEQQRDGAKLEVGAAEDPAEREADAVAEDVVQRLSTGTGSQIAPDAGLQRQESEEEEEMVQAVRRQEQEEEETAV